jgi:hypothetical protein
VSGAVVTLALVAAFALAIGLVQVLGRLIDSGGRADEPPDAGGTRADTAGPDVTGPGRPESASSASRLRPGTAAGALVQGRARGGYPGGR